ncbi:hypothetical protein HN446_04425 [bacterium]|nr:hypothetical protein [bacterium]
MNQIKKTFYIPVPLYAFFLTFVDIALLNITGTFFLHSLFSFFIVYALKKYNIKNYVILFFFLALESFLVTKIFGANLTFIIPLTFLIIIFSKSVKSNFLIHTVCLIAYLTFYSTVIETNLMGAQVGMLYTTSRIFVNLLVILFFEMFMTFR